MPELDEDEAFSWWLQEPRRPRSRSSPSVMGRTFELMILKSYSKPRIASKRRVRSPPAERLHP